MIKLLVLQAANPVSSEILKELSLMPNDVHTAAVCVYPNRVKDAYETIKRMGLLDKICIAAGELIYCVILLWCLTQKIRMAPPIYYGCLMVAKELTLLTHETDCNQMWLTICHICNILHR
jgi:hypothetical protein